VVDRSALEQGWRSEAAVRRPGAVKGSVSVAVLAWAWDEASELGSEPAWAGVSVPVSARVSVPVLAGVSVLAPDRAAGP
jgi:hypothetical protein